MRVGASMMLNVLGDSSGSMEKATKLLADCLPVPGEFIVYMYINVTSFSWLICVENLYKMEAYDGIPWLLL